MTESKREMRTTIDLNSVNSFDIVKHILNTFQELDLIDFNSKAARTKLAYEIVNLIELFKKNPSSTYISNEELKEPNLLVRFVKEIFENKQWKVSKHRIYSENTVQIIFKNKLGE